MGSQHHLQQARSRPKNHVATWDFLQLVQPTSRHENPCHDRPRLPSHCAYVATSNRCRDFKSMSRPKVSSAPSLPCRDAISHVATWGHSILVATEIVSVATQTHLTCLASLVATQTHLTCLAPLVATQKWCHDPGPTMSNLSCVVTQNLVLRPRG